MSDEVILEELDDEDEAAPFCFRCQNTGQVPCRCGGDQCYCDNYGDMPCPNCDRHRYNP